MSKNDIPRLVIQDEEGMNVHMLRKVYYIYISNETRV